MKSGETYSNHYFLVKQKDMHYPKANISYDVTPADGGYRVTLRSDKFARAVYLATGDAEAKFSDNFMDLLPGESVTVMVHTSLASDKFAQQLKVCSLSDAY
jgi:beta-mannosidase